MFACFKALICAHICALHLEMKGKLSQSLSLRYGRGLFWEQPSITYSCRGSPPQGSKPAENLPAIWNKWRKPGRWEDWKELQYNLQYWVHCMDVRFVSDHNHGKPTNAFSKWTVITVMSVKLVVFTLLPDFYFEFIFLFWLENVCCFFPSVY